MNLRTVDTTMAELETAETCLIWISQNCHLKIQGARAVAKLLGAVRDELKGLRAVLKEAVQAVEGADDLDKVVQEHKAEPHLADLPHLYDEMMGDALIPAEILVAVPWLIEG